MENAANSVAPVYSIGTVARMLEISVHTIRMYEREGLIVAYKSTGNQRWYSKADIERIQCIRRGINQHKMSIEGIKRMQALIPCWQIIGCSKKEREGCEAYKNHDKGCWAYKHANTTCVERDCRLCEVYQMSADCEKIKDTLIKVINHEYTLSA